jgi:hypothetical protein
MREKFLAETVNSMTKLLICGHPEPEMFVACVVKMHSFLEGFK